MIAQDRRVAIVGAGAAGLVTARFLAAQGFEPVVFDPGVRVGGQWDRTTAASSVWPDMRANTSRIMTRFSDLDYPDGTPVFPHNEQVRAYLEAYAERLALLPAIQFGMRVDQIARAPAGGYALRVTDAAGRTTSGTFARVVVATGRYHAPFLPALEGLETLRRAGGVTHTSDYERPARVAGARVLVAGGSISGLEVASDLAKHGAPRVVVAMRRQRYVVPKLIGGVPADNLGFRRFGVLAAEAFPPAEVAADLKAFIVAAGGNPAAFGAPSPADNVFEAGITLCQDYVPLLAEGRLEPKPWIECVAGRTVRFQDGTSAEVDAIIMATGFKLSLPFLDPEIRGVLDVDDRHIDLAEFTFHPDLEGLAFVGLYPLIGPYFPVLELQARYVAYSWSGAIPAATREQLSAGVAAYRERRGGRQSQLMHAMAIRFARAAGVEPRPAQSPAIARALLFGPLTATSFRLQGRDALADAARTVADEAARFGTISNPSFTPAERDQLVRLADARRDAEMARLALGA
jgi:cation diffusion facilitator CzcD-associated flavoprotein CzcO